MVVPSSSFLRNRIINGDMRISQRNGTSAGTYGAGAAYWLDRWVNTATIANNMQVQQSTVAPAGFNNSTIFRALTGATIGSSDIFVSQQMIEGLNVGDLAWGTASAATITVSFWVRSSVTGTFGGSIRNGSVNRSYPFTYSIASADTWTYRTVTIPGDTTGTWATDNSAGLSLNFDLGSGSTFRGTAGTWAAANFIGATGSVSPMATNGATFYLTGVQLEVGTVATPFERRQYGQELALCQRYYQVLAAGLRVDSYAVAGASATLSSTFPQMRTAPTGSGGTYSSSTNMGNGPFYSFFVNGFTTGGNASGTGMCTFILNAINLSAEL
jgi:hypothetical protein